MREYDIIAIGGGSGGIATMNRAGEHGAKAAVIEEKKLGGTCVNVGCVPKKIMWYGAQIHEYSTHGVLLVSNTQYYPLRSQFSFTRLLFLNLATTLLSVVYQKSNFGANNGNWKCKKQKDPEGSFR